MRLLIIGDLGGQLIAASRIAVNKGAKVLHVPSIDSAMNTLRDGIQIELIFIEVDQDIEKLIKLLMLEHINVAVIACGIKNDPDKAVKAIEFGAKDYLPLPPQDDLIAAIFANISASDEDLGLMGTSANIRSSMDIATQVAPSDATVLITGESGTGKEIFAKFIHKQSKRFKSELIAVNCAAIPDNLLESELFGHEKGAFTGAVERRIGKFEAANGSTILLDEISEMDIRLQAKLLRVLQEKEIVRVGGNKCVKLDVRVIATSNRNLIDYIQKEKFREDLFYRLNVINIELPPLRERIDDLAKLADYFIIKYARLNVISEKKISPLALNKLRQYKWPGNIRELENCIHRALLLCKTNEIEPHDIMLTGESRSNNTNIRTLEQIEKDAISNTIDNCNGDEMKASLILGISIRSLKVKLRQYKMANN